MTPTQEKSTFSTELPSTTPFAHRVRAYYYSPSAMARRRSCRKSISPEGFEAALRRFEELCRSHRSSPFRQWMITLFEAGRLNQYRLRTSRGGEVCAYSDQAGRRVNF